jgi:hypothetical protein
MKTAKFWTWRNFIIFFGSGFLGICIFFAFQPQYLIPDDKSISAKDKIELENKIRATWFQAIAGLGLFVTAYSAWLNYQTSQQKLETDKDNSEKQLTEIRKKLELDRKISKRNLKLADSKQITERFSKAVEQLGNEESITVRLGAIYSLERIAKNSKYDHWTIMEVLTAFVREKSNDNRKPDSDIPQDIQAALTVIGRRNTEYDLENEIINFRGANLNKANFSKAKLDKANFAEANLTRASFFEANLTEASFFRANLTEAFFYKANLTEAWFHKTNLTEAHFFEANLTEADFQSANVDEKNLTIEQIFEAKNWDKAKYNPNFEKQLQTYLSSLFSEFITKAIF